jgi:hypothetical protein
MIAHLAASTLVALAVVAAGMALRGRSGAWRHALLFAAVLRFAAPTPWLALGREKLAPFVRVRGARPAASAESAMPLDRLAGFLLFGDTGFETAGEPAVRRAGSLIDPYILGWAASAPWNRLKLGYGRGAARHVDGKRHISPS